MTDDLSDEQEPQREQPLPVKDLRVQVKEANRRARAAAKVREALEAELAEARSEKRTADLHAAFREAGLPEATAGLYPQDGESTTEAVAAFAEQHGLTPAREPEPQPEARPVRGFGAPTWGQSPQLRPPTSMDDIEEAIKRGDDSFIERVAAEEAAHPGRIQFRHPDAQEG